MTHFSINRDYIRFGNYAVMIFGHCIIIWWPTIWYLRLGDWFCYPVFCYLAGVGVKETKSPEKYLSSMLVLAIISQYPYMISGVSSGVGSFNIMVPLSLATGLIWLYQKERNEYLLILGLVGSLIGGFNLVFMGVAIMYIVVRYYDKMPRFKQSNLKINKYYIWAIYPAHLMVLGILRYMTQ